MYACHLFACAEKTISIDSPHNVETTFYRNIFLTKATVKQLIMNTPVNPSSAERRRVMPWGYTSP